MSAHDFTFHAPSTLPSISCSYSVGRSTSANQRSLPPVGLVARDRSDPARWDGFAIRPTTLQTRRRADARRIFEPEDGGHARKRIWRTRVDLLALRNSSGEAPQGRAPRRRDAAALPWMFKRRGRRSLHRGELSESKRDADHELCLPALLVSNRSPERRRS